MRSFGSWAGPHRSARGLRQELVPIDDVRRSKTRRNEQFHRLTEQVIASVAEHHFGRGVGVADDPGSVADDHGIGRLLEGLPDDRRAQTRVDAGFARRWLWAGFCAVHPLPRSPDRR